ncbi:unnamed protein product [Rotaria socialis]|uniref:Reverse transcriptase domain-containing protein n=1 Tax=Rotaria socialis TaxID=392032 RepID=A0A821LGS6_9BILA|nr:unnamed protein product [Rotaria socialis]
MTANNYHCKTRSNSGLVCDTQGCSYELLSPTQVLTENVQNLENSIKEKKKKKKCKGNRKLQHFKRKCRSNGMNEELITKLIENRNTDHNSIKSTDNTKINKDMKNKKNQSKKRKRFQLLNEDKPNVIKSLSQLSISQPLRKKTKNEDKLASNSNNNNNNNNKSSKYLKMPKKLLYHSLRVHLYYPLKRKKEKIFILTRLQLLDWQFCLNLDLHLYQSYYTEGRQYKTWPEDIVKMAKTNDYDLTETFFNKLVNQIQHTVDQCTTELLSQSLSCPKTLLLSHIESRLVEFVRLHHIDLIRKLNYQVNKFKDLIRETQLFETLSSYSLTNEQKQAVDCLINIRQNQLETFEEMTMLEARIVCKSLSRSIDDLDKLILIDETLLNYMSTNNNISFKDETHQQYRKKIREYKRQVLMKNFEDYETSIEENEYLYQEELLKFEYELSKDIESVNNLMNSLYYYLNHRTDRLIRDIRYKEALFRIKLTHPHSHGSSSSSSSKIDSVSVYPEAIIETSETLFTDEEIKFLSYADSIIRVTNKSGIFHIGSTLDYDEKVKKYQAKTNAYIQLSSDPLMDTFYKTGTPLRPIVSGMNTPTTKISKMLDRLIRPLFDQYVKQATIIDGVHLIRQLDKCVSLGLLKPTTHLCTFDITDLYTMLPQEESIAILKQFLIRFNQTHTRGMSINTIESLARGAMGSPFTLTLANIFMWHWEQKLVEKQKASNELYGRYIDDIFLTSNDSTESLRDMLENANKYHVNIKLTHEIGSCVSFLDVQINNQDGNLITSVYHKEASEPYIVPFKSDHPRHIFENIITTSLLRAIRYFSTLQAFNHEIRALKLMLLYNSFPSRYIRHYLKKFFQQLSATSISILPMIHDENEYVLLRTKLLSKPTASEHARASRIATTLDNKRQNITVDPLVHTKDSMSVAHRFSDNHLRDYCFDFRRSSLLFHLNHQAKSYLLHQMNLFSSK